MKVRKNNGKFEDFEIMKIIEVLHKANDRNEDDSKKATSQQIRDIANIVADEMAQYDEIDSFAIQDVLENALIENCLVDLARFYIIGCYEKKMLRKKDELDESILSLIANNNQELAEENSNKNATLVSTQRDYMAGEVSKDIYKRLILPPHLVDAHNKGLIHIHDMDYLAQPLTNCCLVNIEDMLQNGTVISDVMIETPKSLRTAATVTTQISAMVSSNQYGGQSINLAHLVPFVDVSRQKHRKDVKAEIEKAGVELTEDKINEIAESRLEREIKDSIQTMNYQWSTISSTNGQTPFVTLFMYLNDPSIKTTQMRDDLARLIKEVLVQRIQGVKNKEGYRVSLTFPKLIYVTDENNIHDDSEYFWLTKLSAECTSKTMMPDYISAKVMKKLKQGDVYSVMGCRSALTPDPINHKYWGRFNIGVVTINLPDVALSSGGNPEKFWKILDERLDLCYQAQKIRVNYLSNTPAKVAPMLWQYGALARLDKDDKISKLFYNNYATISLGYAGLYEAVYYMTGKSHTNDMARDFGLDIMKHLNDACDRWKKESGISYSLYGTPLESTTYKFSRCLQERFGKVKGVSDKDYITNSYH